MKDNNLYEIPANKLLLDNQFINIQSKQFRSIKKTEKSIGHLLKQSNVVIFYQ